MKSRRPLLRLSVAALEWGGFLLLAFLCFARPSGAQDTGILHVRPEEAANLSQPGLVDAFYQPRGYLAAWSSDGRPGPLAFALLQALQQSERNGVEPSLFGLVGIGEAQEDTVADGRLSPRARTLLDLRLTDAFMQYGIVLLGGRVDPRGLHPGWSLEARQADLVALLEAALRGGGIASVLASLEPVDSQYRALQGVLATYRRLAAQGGWKPLQSGPVLRLGDVEETIPALRERLRLTGDLDASVDPGTPDSLDRFDVALERAVRAFQQRHGLEEDGIVGRHTRAALAVPAAERVRQIALNMERRRWLPSELGRRHLHVNLAGYELSVVEDGLPVRTMRVMTGTRRHGTPVFSTRLTEVVLAPYWEVPQSIAQNEILPRARQDDGYLARNGFKRLPNGRLRQNPGPGNSLGRLKFIIPNSYGIGLHDTPERYLFERSSRPFSHGCIRVEEPIELALYVLRQDSAWTRAQVEATIGAWVETRVLVPDPFPVHVLYWTAWVDAQGLVHFREDVYGYDTQLEQALRVFSVRSHR